MTTPEQPTEREWLEGLRPEDQASANTDRGLAEVLRRLLAKSHSLTGRKLTVGDITVDLTDDEFDLVWEALDEIDGEDFTLRAVSDIDFGSPA